MGYADIISYNNNTNIVIASGNVCLCENKGNIFISNYIELKGNLKKGFLNKVISILKNETLITSKSINYTYNLNIKLKKNFYSPCKINNNPILWGIQSEESSIIKQKKTIHSNSILKILGFPILY